MRIGMPVHFDFYAHTHPGSDRVGAARRAGSLSRLLDRVGVMLGGAGLETMVRSLYAGKALNRTVGQNADYAGVIGAKDAAVGGSDEHGAGTIRAVARKLGVHRREVRKALARAMPAERRNPERERPRLAAAIPFIDGILESDRKAPRKQRHTAHRVSHWQLESNAEPSAVGATTTMPGCFSRRQARIPSGTSPG